MKKSEVLYSTRPNRSSAPIFWQSLSFPFINNDLASPNRVGTKAVSIHTYIFTQKNQAKQKEHSQIWIPGQCPISVGGGSRKVRAPSLSYFRHSNFFPTISQYDLALQMPIVRVPNNILWVATPNVTHQTGVNTYLATTGCDHTWPVAPDHLFGLIIYLINVVGRDTRNMNTYNTWLFAFHIFHSPHIQSPSPRARTHCSISQFVLPFKLLQYRIMMMYWPTITSPCPIPSEGYIQANG